HGYRAADVWLFVELGFQFLARAACAGAVRTAGLRHEALDHAMEYDAVVKPFAYQFLDARDMAGREIGSHFDGDCAFGGVEYQRVLGICHGIVSGILSLITARLSTKHIDYACRQLNERSGCSARLRSFSLPKLKVK